MDFEKSFLRLEEILEKMNGGSITLDTSLKLYEEADSLIQTCAKRLSDAETKIETLIKNRSGALAKNEAGEPLTQAFSVDNAPTT